MTDEDALLFELSDTDVDQVSGGSRGGMDPNGGMIGG